MFEKKANEPLNHNSYYRINVFNILRVLNNMETKFLNHGSLLQAISFFDPNNFNNFKTMSLSCFEWLSSRLKKYDAVKSGMYSNQINRLLKQSKIK